MSNSYQATRQATRKGHLAWRRLSAWGGVFVPEANLNALLCVSPDRGIRPFCFGGDGWRRARRPVVDPTPVGDGAGPAIGQTYTKVFALPLITTVQVITARRRLMSGQSPKAIRFAEQAWTDLDW